jgi:hypothetical protein
MGIVESTPALPEDEEVAAKRLRNIKRMDMAVRRKIRNGVQVGRQDRPYRRGLVFG